MNAAKDEVLRLRDVAHRIAKAGINGFGNELNDIADALAASMPDGAEAVVWADPNDVAEQRQSIMATANKWEHEGTRYKLPLYATPQLPAQGWMAIESAPNNDKVCVIGWAESRYRDGYGVVIMRWFACGKDLLEGYWTCNAIQYYPTHWMPLPAPPAPKETRT
jgi:hypothetical protein